MLHYDTVEREGDSVLLRVRGELAGRLWTERLQESLERHYVDDGVKRIRLDLSEVSFLDNYGVATLVALHRESRDRGKRLVIEGPRPQAEEKLRVTGVLEMMREGG